MWDSSTLSGGAEWTWSPCCTDGMALGPMPAEVSTLDPILPL